ncbi:MAG: 1-acyl-sn-glycerol-3-phosphate acyltransferase [Treponema sp.]|nr:1-acyl-sn-glycerol-3-phosphate acyltransferase [Treponema sp.]
MGKENDESWRYSAADLPKPKNRILYTYRCIVKILAVFFFGFGSLLFGLIILPPLRLLLHPSVRFKKTARLIASTSFCAFVKALQLFGGIRLDIDAPAEYRKLRSAILVANHPSKLDVVFLIALIPNADCIVRGSLTKGPLAWVIRQLYIVNDLGYEQLLDHCKKSLSEGANIIIFPEGTRTPRHGTNPFKRGAAHIAYDTGADIQLLYIGGNDKYGLGKHDPIFSYNREEIYHYDFHLLPKIRTSDYSQMPAQIATRRMTEKMHEVLAGEALSRDGKVI